MSTGKFKISIKKGLNGKPDASSQINLATQFIPLELSRSEIINHIKNGDGFSAHYKNNYRKTINFICSDFVAADFDGNLSINEVLENEFVSLNASFLYTTASHTKEQHRFRVVFLLEKTIVKADEWANCLLGLAIRLGSDISIKDAGRFFFGNPSAKVKILGNLLSNELVTNLISIGRDNRILNKNPLVSSLPSQSSNKLDSSFLLRTKTGDVYKLSDIGVGTSVYCPVHFDKKASAFVVKSTSGGKGVHCMACNMSYWSDEGDQYDFDAFDRLVNEKIGIDEINSQKVDPEANFIESLFPPKPQVKVYQDRFLSVINYESGVTVIKSPKGSGKTEALKELVRSVLQNDLTHLPRNERPKSVLLIGHRRSLIREASNKLGLSCYLDFMSSDSGDHSREKGFSICLDSLHRITESFSSLNNSRKYVSSGFKPYDLVIIDESEQVFSHLLSETIRKGVGVSSVYSALELQLRSAKSVIALDADLGLVTAHALKCLRPRDWEHSFRIIINKPLEVQNKRTLFVFKSKKMLLERLLSSIRQGKRIFVASNSKKAIDTISAAIVAEFSSTIKFISITSDNSRNETEKYFVENIQTEYLKYQVLLCSPSLGTGIDISFPDGRQEVDEVIGFFYSFINTHTDIDQQLSRVRNPGSVSIWFDSARFNYETNFDVVRHNLAVHNFVPSAVQGTLSDDGEVVYDKDHPLLMITAHTTCAQRSSKKNLYKLFQKLRMANGWSIETIEKNIIDKPDKKWSEAKRTVADKRVQGILEAKDLIDDDFLDLAMRDHSGDKLSRVERFELERGSLSRIFNVPISEELITRDENGRLREKVNRFQMIIKIHSESPHIFKDITKLVQDKKPLKKTQDWVLIMVLMLSCDVFNDEGFNLAKKVVVKNLGPFVDMCRRNQFLIEETFGIVLREDLSKNPIRQLNVILGLIGLKLVKVKRRKKSGRSNFEYVLDHAGYKFVSELSLNFKELKKPYERD